MPEPVLCIPLSDRGELLPTASAMFVGASEFRPADADVLTIPPRHLFIQVRAACIAAGFENALAFHRYYSSGSLNQSI